MTFDEIKELIQLVNESELSEIKVKEGEFEISIRTEHYSRPLKHTTANLVSTPMLQNTAPVQDGEDSKGVGQGQDGSKGEEDGDNIALNDPIEVRSPIVGTFYRSSSPDKSPFVKVGDSIEVGDVVCIVEAMKLFNEIETEVAGKIIKVMVDDAQPVQYDQVLFILEA